MFHLGCTWWSTAPCFVKSHSSLNFSRYLYIYIHVRMVGATLQKTKTTHWSSQLVRETLIFSTRCEYEDCKCCVHCLHLCAVCDARPSSPVRLWRVDPALPGHVAGDFFVQVGAVTVLLKGTLFHQWLYRLYLSSYLVDISNVYHYYIVRCGARWRAAGCQTSETGSVNTTSTLDMFCAVPPLAYRINIIQSCEQGGSRILRTLVHRSLRSIDRLSEPEEQASPCSGLTGLTNIELYLDTPWDCHMHTLTPLAPPQLIGSPMAVPLVVFGICITFNRLPNGC